jgi:4a-hydroxytetrahydrobiopterin dehydratase
MEKLNDEQVQQGLSELQGWKKEKEYIIKEYQFKDFVEAFGFMTKVAIIAESIGHHPNWYNVNHIVQIKLSTHDVDGLTEKDFLLAKRIDELLSNVF